MTHYDMNPGENDLLAKMERLDEGTLYVSYRCRECGQEVKTADQGKEIACPMCDGKMAREAK